MTIPHPNTSEPPVSQSAPPAWVRAVDLICLLVVAVAAIVAMSGGFRVRVVGLRLAFTSPYRLLFWAIVVGAVRHFAYPSVRIYRDLPTRLEDWWHRPSVQSAAAVVLGTRPVILFVGYLAVIMFGYAGGRAPLRHSDNEIVNLNVRWDAGWYLGIVTSGYVFETHDPEAQQNIVFFPAYPILVRGVGRLLGNTLPSHILAGTLVSFAAFFGGLVYLFAFARQMLTDDQARYAQWLIAAYPFAVFFGAIYSESLFLFGAVGAFYHFTNRQFGRAAVCGVLVGLTRHVGCLLSIPLALLAIEAWLPAAVVGGAGRLPIPRRSVVKALAAAAAPGVGMLIYAAYIWKLTGDPLAWVWGHAAWGRTYQGVAALVLDRYDFIAHAGVAGYVAAVPHDVLNALGVAFVLATAWPVARCLGLAYAVLILITILPPLAAGGLTSTGRVSSLIFPSFVWLAGAVPPDHRGGWIATFGSLQALIAALFYTWRPVY